MAVEHDVSEIEASLKAMLKVNTQQPDAPPVQTGLKQELQEAARELEQKTGKKKKERKRNKKTHQDTPEDTEDKDVQPNHLQQEPCPKLKQHNSTADKPKKKKSKQKAEKKDGNPQNGTEDEPFSELDFTRLGHYLDDKLTKEVFRELEKDRVFPLKKKSLKFPYAKYFCRLCEYHCDTVTVCRQHVKDARHRRKREILEQDKKIRRVPAPTEQHVQALDELLAKIFEEHGLRDKDLAYRQEVTANVEEYLHQTEPDLGLRMYGSSLSGLGLRSNDLNIDLVIAKDTNPAKALTSVFTILKKTEEYQGVRSNFSANIPSVLFTVGEGEGLLHCEITVSNDTAYNTNKLLSFYRKVDPRVRILATAFRYWAKVCQVDGQEEGSLPRYCLSLMTVYHLQRCSPPVVPTLWMDLTEEQLKRPRTAADVSEMFEVLEQNVWKSHNSQRVGALWLNMLNFYGVNFDLGMYVIAIKQFNQLSRSEKKWNNKRIAIEDPFFTKRNVARSLSNSRMFEYFYNCLRRACLYFGRPSNQQDMSIFSPNSLSEDSIKNDMSESNKQSSKGSTVGKDLASATRKQKGESDSKNDETELTDSGETSSDGGIKDHEFIQQDVDPTSVSRQTSVNDNTGHSGDVLADLKTDCQEEKENDSSCSDSSQQSSDTDTSDDEKQESVCVCVPVTGVQPLCSVASEDSAVCEFRIEDSVCDTCGFKKQTASPTTRRSGVAGGNSCTDGASDSGSDDEEDVLGNGVDSKEQEENPPVRSSGGKKRSTAEYQFDFNMDVLTDGKGPAVICSLCEKEGHLKMACPEEKLPEMIELPPMTKQHLQQLTAVVKQVPRDFKLTNDEVYHREMIRRDLERFIQELYPDAQLKLFGSSCNGFGFHFSDLDICVTFSKRSQEELDYVEIIEAMTAKMKTHRGLYGVFPITTAKVPIIKFRHRDSQLEGDISLYNILAQHNTKLLYTYSCIDPRVNILGFAIKVFAKVCDIGDASKGSLSSYAYMLLMLHYLQHTQPPIIPVLQELYDPSKPRPELIVDGRNTWFYNDLQHLPEIWPHYGKNSQSVGELWVGFFRYYTEEFIIQDQVITIKQFGTLSKFEKLWNGCCLALEDPFDLSHNLGAGLSRKMNRYILATLIHAREVYGTPVNKIPDGFKTIQDYFFDRNLLTEGEPPNDRCCRVCNKIGHIAKECPKVAARKEREAQDRQRREENKARNERKANERNDRNSQQNVPSGRVQESPRRSFSDPDDRPRGSRSQNSRSPDQYNRQQSYSPVKNPENQPRFQTPPKYSQPPMRQYQGQMSGQGNVSQHQMAGTGHRGQDPGRGQGGGHQYPQQQKQQQQYQQQQFQNMMFFNQNHARPRLPDNNGGQGMPGMKPSYQTGPVSQNMYSRGPVPFSQYQRQQKNMPNESQGFMAMSANQPSRYSEPGASLSASSSSSSQGGCPQQYNPRPAVRQVTAQKRSLNVDVTIKNDLYKKPH